MKKHLVLTALIAFLSIAGYRMTTSARAETPATQPTTQPVNKMCAVEGEDEVDPAVTTVYKGQVIGFCCKGCVAKFTKDPEKYMKTLK